MTVDRFVLARSAIIGISLSVGADSAWDYLAAGVLLTLVVMGF
jgi:hypothetical protein